MLDWTADRNPQVCNAMTNLQSLARRRSMLADRLLSKGDYECDRELRTLELLKVRRGGHLWAFCLPCMHSYSSELACCEPRHRRVLLRQNVCWPAHHCCCLLLSRSGLARATCTMRRSCSR